MGKVYLGDDGTVFLIDTTVDISAATKLVLKVKPPDDPEVEWVGEVDPSVNTKIRYVSSAADLAALGVGRHSIQSYIESTDFDGRGDTVPFTVYAHHQ